MENDPNLTAPQPWAARMRYDAADARRLGCTGLLGIHWRTKILAPNVAALAAAAWDQSWAPADFATQPIPPLPVTLKGNENPLRARAMPIDDFYIDFARASFGDTIAEEAGRILASVDGVNLPEPATWQKGPGGIKPDKAPWEQTKTRYSFVTLLPPCAPKCKAPATWSVSTTGSTPTATCPRWPKPPASEASSTRPWRSTTPLRLLPSEPSSPKSGER